MTGLTKAMIAYVNQVDSPDSTITASASATKFPVRRVANAYRQVKWRSTSTSAWVQITQASEFDVSCGIACDTNLTSAATVELQGSSDGFVTHDTLQIDAQSADPWVWFGEMKRYKAYRVVFSDPSNPDGYIEVGRLFLGTFVTVDRNYTNDMRLETVNLSVTQRATNGVEHAVVRPAYPVIQLPFEAMDDDQKTTFKAVLDVVGTHTSFWIALDYDSFPKTETYYVKFEGPPSYVPLPPFWWNTHWALRGQV